MAGNLQSAYQRCTLMLILLLFYWEIKLKKLCKLVSISLFVYEKVLPSGQNSGQNRRKSSL